MRFSGPKIEQARSAALQVIEALDDGDLVGGVEHGDRDPVVQVRAFVVVEEVRHGEGDHADHGHGIKFRDVA